ncbi:hypothetical protein K7432_014743 [Basidiobolus ranarum]|uniref:Uncharacterized protein n=1 Tax=Basidiobolus ranarum TaxID=34480 RepID=A0ABR2VP30_9FUNG
MQQNTWESFFGSDYGYYSLSHSMSRSVTRQSSRTHEENQERAYIAASHRGDRPLEGRLKSAHKASEIHKRRTGKSLKITEEDVLNEEMYAEVSEDEAYTKTNETHSKIPEVS